MGDFEDYSMKGRTYRFMSDALFPFGFGLSYTTFEFSNGKTNTKAINAEGTLTLSIDITNTGKRKGDEVVQLYIQHLYSIVVRPVKELKAFQRITLNPGERKTVQLKIKAIDLQYWDENLHKFVLENDCINLMEGCFSPDFWFQDIVNTTN